MYWVEVCNDAAGWACLEGARRLVPSLAAEEHAALVRDAGLLVRLVAARYLGLSLPSGDQAALSAWLKSVQVAFRGPTRNPSIPPLFAHRRGQLAEPFESTVSSALLQFLAADPESVARVHRCHGVVRRTEENPSLYPTDWEPLFAERAGIAAFLDRSATRQCAVWIAAHRGGRYCSKSCANAAFAARKAASEPDYFAAKQERYRLRQERQSRQRSSRAGALVFID